MKSEPLQSLEILTSLVAAADNATEREVSSIDSRRDSNTRSSRNSPPPTWCWRQLAFDSQPNADRQSPHKYCLFVDLKRNLKVYPVSGNMTDVEAFIDQALIGRSLENLVQNAMQVVPEDVVSFRSRWLKTVVM